MRKTTIKPAVNQHGKYCECIRWTAGTHVFTVFFSSTLPDLVGHIYDLTCVSFSSQNVGKKTGQLHVLQLSY